MAVNKSFIPPKGPSFASRKLYEKSNLIHGQKSNLSSWRKFFFSSVKVYGWIRSVVIDIIVITTCYSFGVKFTKIFSSFF